jgi:hypothetical protein
MSIDYEIYMGNKFPENRIQDFSFIKESIANGILRGPAFGGLLFLVIAENRPADSFVREEVGFQVLSKLILSPDLDDYESSMAALVQVVSTCVEVSDRIKLYQNNELLLLEKKDGEVVVYNRNGEWHEEHLKLLKFDYVER